MSNTNDDNDKLLRIIAAQSVQIFDLCAAVESLSAENEAVSELLKELLKQAEPETPAPPAPVTKAELQDTVKMLNAGDSQSDIDTRLAALEVSKRAVYLTDLPLTLTPEALKDKTIN